MPPIRAAPTPVPRPASAAPRPIGYPGLSNQQLQAAHDRHYAHRQLTEARTLQEQQSRTIQRMRTHPYANPQQQHRSDPKVLENHSTQASAQAVQPIQASQAAQHPFQNSLQHQFQSGTQQLQQPAKAQPVQVQQPHPPPTATTSHPQQYPKRKREDEVLFPNQAKRPHTGKADGAIVHGWAQQVGGREMVASASAAHTTVDSTGDAAELFYLGGNLPRLVTKTGLDTQLTLLPPRLSPEQQQSSDLAQHQPAHQQYQHQLSPNHSLHRLQQHVLPQVAPSLPTHAQPTLHPHPRSIPVHQPAQPGLPHPLPRSPTLSYLQPTTPLPDHRGTPPLSRPLAQHSSRPSSQSQPLATHYHPYSRPSSQGQGNSTSAIHMHTSAHASSLHTPRLHHPQPRPQPQPHPQPRSQAQVVHTTAVLHPPVPASTAVNVQPAAAAASSSLPHQAQNDVYDLYRQISHVTSLSSNTPTPASTHASTPLTLPVGGQPAFHSHIVAPTDLSFYLQNHLPVHPPNLPQLPAQRSPVELASTPPLLPVAPSLAPPPTPLPPPPTLTPSQVAAPPPPPTEDAASPPLDPLQLQIDAFCRQQEKEIRMEAHALQFLFRCQLKEGVRPEILRAPVPDLPAPTKWEATIAGQKLSLKLNTGLLAPCKITGTYCIPTLKATRHSCLDCNRIMYPKLRSQ